MALAFGLCPAGDEQAVANDLARDVVDRHHGHQSTGIFGSRYLFDRLAASGHGTVALAMLRQTDYPSIGYLFSLGATTFWECWGEPDLDKRWGARSLNHPMQAGYDAWFFQGLAGINPDPAAAGFRNVVVRPEVIGDLQWVRAYHDSPYGRITSAWRRTGDKLALDVTVPPNATATVYVPTRTAVASGGPESPSRVRESGISASNARSVRFLRWEGNADVFEVGSGTYHFESKIR
jgi:alpha-L-rhamnosidase